jgi:hypothetical protein
MESDLAPREVDMDEHFEVLTPLVIGIMEDLEVEMLFAGAPGVARQSEDGEFDGVSGWPWRRMLSVSRREGSGKRTCGSSKRAEDDSILEERRSIDLIVDDAWANAIGEKESKTDFLSVKPPAGVDLKAAVGERRYFAHRDYEVVPTLARVEASLGQFVGFGPPQ